MANPGDLMAPVEERLRTLEPVTGDAAATHWARRCAAEGWPVGSVQLGRDARPQRTHRERASAPNPGRGAATARAAIERVRTVVTAMSDADLAGVAFVNSTFQGDVRWVVRSLMPQHADGHLASIASALAT